MTEKEAKKAKEAVEISLECFKDALFLNFEFSEKAKEFIEDIYKHEIKCGLDDIDRIINGQPKCGVDEFYTEWNHHWAM